MRFRKLQQDMFFYRMQCDICGYLNNWRQAKAWNLLPVGAVEMNPLTQGALRQFTQWLWIELPNFWLRGGHSPRQICFYNSVCFSIRTHLKNRKLLIKCLFLVKTDETLGHSRKTCDKIQTRKMEMIIFSLLKSNAFTYWAKIRYCSCEKLFENDFSSMIIHGITTKVTNFIFNTQKLIYNCQRRTFHGLRRYCCLCAHNHWHKHVATITGTNMGPTEPWNPYFEDNNEPNYEKNKFFQKHRCKWSSA